MADALGAKIKLLRIQAGITGRELGRRVEAPQSYVSKIERGLVRPKPEFCRRVAKALSLSKGETDELMHLLALYNADNKAVPQRADAAEDRRQAVRKLEEDSLQIYLYEPYLIPDLLQTRSYMRAVLSHGAAAEDSVDMAVRQGEEQQKILRQSGRQFRFVIDEMALHRRVAPLEVLEEQMDALANQKRLNLRIRYLPIDAEIPADVKLAMAGFKIIDQSAVVTENLPGSINTFIHPDEVAEYKRTFNRLFEMAEKQMPTVRFEEHYV